MPLHPSDSLLQKLPEDSSQISQPANLLMLSEAFDALPDAVYLFNENGRLVQANSAAAVMQPGELREGKACCEMFWRVEGAVGCIVDRALQTREKVEVEILAGAEGKDSISMIVEPLGGGDNKLAALVIARDISDLRRAEAEAIDHKSFLASIADRTPDEIFALDTAGRITWLNERASTLAGCAPNAKRSPISRVR